MKPKAMPIALAMVLCTTLAGFARTAAAHECSLADVAGKYGYTTVGSIVTPAVGPFAAVGHATLTEAGTFSGGQTTSVAGNFYTETVEGTYTVNRDCTGTATVYVYRGSTLARTSYLNLVWDNHESEARAIFLAPGTAITITFRKMFGED